MPKVKMSDIKSESENVRDVFRIPMASRTWKWIQTKTFTNKELQEIHDISSDIEKSKVRKKFYSRLIRSQSGPFDDTIFRIFSDILYDKESMLHLLVNSVGVDNSDKVRWMKYAIETSPWFVYDFMLKGDSAQYGIDITKGPFNIHFADFLIQSKDKLLNAAAGMPDYYLDAIYTTLDTMNEKEFDIWHSYVQFNKEFFEIILKYKNTPVKLLQEMFDDYNDAFNKGQIAEHPNSPQELRHKMFEYTGDAKWLPEEVQDIFIF